MLTDNIVAARKVRRDEISRVRFGMVAAGDSTFYYTVKPEIKQ